MDISTLSSWYPTAERSFPILEASNRYFSNQQEAQGQDVMQLGKYVDPYGILAKLGEAQGVLHLQDNQVEYFERRQLGQGKK